MLARFVPFFLSRRANIHRRTPRDETRHGRERRRDFAQVAREGVEKGRLGVGRLDRFPVPNLVWVPRGEMECR